MAYLGNYPALGIFGTGNIQDFAVTPAKLSTGAPFWNSSGNFGIGTISPERKFHVIGTASATTDIVRVGVTSGPSIGLGTEGTNYSWIQAFGGKPLYINPQGNDVVFNAGGGNLGLGVTPSATWTGKAFETGYAGNALLSGGFGQFWMTANAIFNSGTGWKYGGSNLASIYQQQNGQHLWFTAPSGTAGNAISFTQAMTLTAAGRLLIGTTTSGGATPQYPLSLGVGIGRKLAVYDDGFSSGVASGFGIDMGGSSYELSSWVGTSGGGNGVFTWGQVNTTSNTFSERMRLTAAGALCAGATAAGFSSTTSVILDAPGGYLIVNHLNTAGGTGYALFGYNGTGIGSITQNGTSTVSYNTNSDYRLKENVAPMTGALATVAALKPCTYTWKADGSAGQGFIAHELQAVVPDCVTGEKDAVDADGKPQYQGVDTSFLVATLVAAIQELKAEVDALKEAA